MEADHLGFRAHRDDGNRMHSIVGPNWCRRKRASGVRRASSSAWIRFRAIRKENFDIAEWYFLTGNTRFRGQVTHEIVHAPHGKIIGPWEFRRRPAFLEALFRTLSGSQQDRMRQAYWRDWSPWLVSDEIYTVFKSAKLTRADVG